MLFVKDFRTNLTSYRLILEDSKTNMGQTKVYDFNSDRFGGVSSRAAYAMLNDINNGEYKITLNINANNSTLELLATLNGYANNEYIPLNFNQFKNAMPTFSTEKLYAVLKSNNNSISYITGYKEENNKISLITIKETAKNDNIIDQHFNLIKTTGEYNGKRLQKFNRVQLLALMFMSKNFNANIFTL